MRGKPHRREDAGLGRDAVLPVRVRLPRLFRRAARQQGRGSGPLWTMPQLQELFDEWVISAWQNKPHDGLRDPLAPGQTFTPNEKYAALVKAAGYVPVALSADDYIELLPAEWKAVNHYGIKTGYRVYDSKELNPYRPPALRGGVEEQPVGSAPRPLRHHPRLGPRPSRRRRLDHRVLEAARRQARPLRGTGLGPRTGGPAAAGPQPVRARNRAGRAGPDGPRPRRPRPTRAGRAGRAAPRHRASGGSPRSPTPPGRPSRPAPPPRRTAARRWLRLQMLRGTPRRARPGSCRSGSSTPARRPGRDGRPARPVHFPR